MNQFNEVHIYFTGSSFNFNAKNCWCDRGKSMIYLIEKAFKLLKNKNIVKKMKPFKKMFYVGDWENGDYSTCSATLKGATIPCPMFDHWKECKIKDYDTECLKISKKSKIPYTHNKILWIGQPSNKIREKFVKDYSNNPRVSAISLRSHWGHSTNIIKGYISLPDHCKYRYLIDLEGIGYSARIKFLMNTRRPLFIQKRRFNEYWFYLLKEYKHYIPVANDLSDLDKQLKWADNNVSKCLQIAKNAANFAAKNLRKKDAIKRLSDILYKLGTEELK